MANFDEFIEKICKIEENQVYDIGCRTGRWNYQGNTQDIFTR